MENLDVVPKKENIEENTVIRTYLDRKYGTRIGPFLNRPITLQTVFLIFQQRMK